MASDVITRGRALGLTVSVDGDGIPMAVCLRCGGTGLDRLSPCPPCEGTGEVELAWMVCWLTAAAEALHLEGVEARELEKALPF